MGVSSHASVARSRATFIGSILVMLLVGFGQVSQQPAQAGERGPFSLVDHRGRSVTDLTFRGKFMLVFFGYTHCPDICPTDLQIMGAALDHLGGRSRRVQPIFVTIDPQRDTAEVLAAYVPNFHPRMVGLTGTPAQIASAAAVYRVRYRKFFPASESAPYLLDHSASIYLVGPKGRPLSHYPHGMTSKAIAADIRRFLK